MSVLQNIYEKRLKFAELLKDPEYSGIREIVEDLYPDRAHFIYELLQNAEDTRATEAKFHLTEHSLIFEHNGRPFTEADIEGITNIGKGTKKDDPDKIGRFGIGFKAIFAFCETPFIWSSTYNFKIVDLVLPTPLSSRPHLGNSTRFEFPFNNPKKSPEQAHQDILEGLSKLSELTLLFLRHLENLSWQVDGGPVSEILRVQHSSHHHEVVQQFEGSVVQSRHFLKFTEHVREVPSQYITVAYEMDFLPGVDTFDVRLPLGQQMKIGAASPGRVAVFFPAEKENAGLRFHLHAPFVPELSRASIKDTPINRPLFQQLADLVGVSLFEIRDLGLLTPDFLNVLPNPQDLVPDRYQVIWKVVQDVLNELPLVPTHDKQHRPARELVQGRTSLKELLTGEDLKFLQVNAASHPLWVAGVMRGSHAEKLLQGLKITPWDVEQLVLYLIRYLSQGESYSSMLKRHVFASDANVQQWLKQKPLAWHQAFYALLQEDYLDTLIYFRQQYAVEELKKVRLVRLDSGDYTAGPDAFFSSGTGTAQDGLPRVDPECFSSGKRKNEQESARKLLVTLGVREVGLAERVEAILKQRYTPGNSSPSIEDISVFIELLDKDPRHADLFKNRPVLKIQNGTWRTPEGVFLDRPFLETGLLAWYPEQDNPQGPWLLSTEYLDCGVAPAKVVGFARTIGAQTELRVSIVSCRENPKWDHLRAVAGNITHKSIDQDYRLAGFEERFKKPTLDVALLVWKTLQGVPKKSPTFTARFQRNQRGGMRQVESQLTHQLQNTPWIPQGEGVFVTPAQASRELLPEGFAFDSGWDWLETIRFGVEGQRALEEKKRKQKVLEEHGISITDDHAINRFNRFSRLSPEKQEMLLEQMERQQVEFPQHQSANPDRRADKVAAQAAEAPDRSTEERTRSVSRFGGEVKKDARQYLRQMYTHDGEMYCQVCHKPVPFKLEDGTGYFEAVDFLPELELRHKQNYLALCPNHAAMFRHAHGSKDTQYADMLSISGVELSVTLAQTRMTISFTRTHLQDLRTIASVELEQAQQKV